MVSAKVGKFQKALKAEGFNLNGNDNVFEPDTLQAVEAFQKANKVVVDGEVGRDTARVLGIKW